MAAISRAQQLKELLPGLNALFGLEYKQYGEEHKDIFQTETSDRSFEEEQKLSGFGQASVKTEGDSIMYDTAQEAFTARYVHETIAMGFAITEEAMEDNLYESISKRYTKALARSMAYTKQVKAAAILNGAFAGGPTYGDGQVLCSGTSATTGHPLISGGWNQNRPFTAVDLNETSLEAAIIQIGGWTDERGLLIAAKPQKLIVHRSDQFNATRILETEVSTTLTSANFPKNDVNAIRNNGAIPGGFSVNHYLTDDDSWFLITDVPNGLKHFIRAPLKTAMDGDFDTGNVRYKARERYVFGVSDPLGIYGAPGS